MRQPAHVDPKSKSPAAEPWADRFAPRRIRLLLFVGIAIAGMLVATLILWALRNPLGFAFTPVLFFTGIGFVGLIGAHVLGPWGAAALWTICEGAYMTALVAGSVTSKRSTFKALLFMFIALTVFNMAGTINSWIKNPLPIGNA